MAEKRKQNETSNKSTNYFKRSKGIGGAKLEVGMQGVLISHDRHKEKFCTIDAFKLLNYFADAVYGVEKIEQSNEDEDNDDIESALSNEVSEIKDSVKSPERRRFSTAKSGCNNLIFIRFKDITPSTFMSNIVKKICDSANSETKNMPQIRHVLRTHPVDFSCSAYFESMCKNIPLFLEKRFQDFDGDDILKQFTIEYKSRNNSHLSRQAVLDGMYEEMKDSTSGWRYNCRSQSVTVIIDVLKTVCLVSVVKDYYVYRKYNIRELFTHKCPMKQDRPKKELEIKQSTEETKEELISIPKTLDDKDGKNIYEHALLSSEVCESQNSNGSPVIENATPKEPEVVDAGDVAEIVKPDKESEGNESKSE